MLFDRSQDMIGHCITLRQRIYLQWGGISTTVQPPSCFQPDPNLPLVFYPTQISTRPKPHSCFWPDPNLFPVFDPTQTSFLISTRPKPPSRFLPDPNLFPVFDPSQTSFPFSTQPKPLSCFRRESNVLPVFYPTQTFLKQTNKKGKQTSRRTNQKEKYTILTQGFKQPLIRQLNRKNYYERQMSK